MTENEAKRIIEALLFISNKPVSLNDIKRALEELDGRRIKELLEGLKSEYEGAKRGFLLEEVAGGWQLVTDPYFAPWIRKFYKKEITDKLSRPALETLAIIAYKQPVTRGEIESIRGVNVDGVLRTLSDRSLIKISGRKEAPGRPIIYVTTREFLERFGLPSLAHLPRVEEFEPKEKQLSKEVQDAIKGTEKES